MACMLRSDDIINLMTINLSNIGFNLKKKEVVLSYTHLINDIIKKNSKCNVDELNKYVNISIEKTKLIFDDLNDKYECNKDIKSIHFENSYMIYISDE